MNEIDKTSEQKDHMKREIAFARESADQAFREAKEQKKKDRFFAENRLKIEKLIELLNVGTFDIEIAGLLSMKCSQLATFKKKIRGYGIELPQRRGRRRIGERMPVRGVLDEG